MRELKDVTMHEGISAPELEYFRNSQVLNVPSSHAEALRFSNGIETYGGYYRLFGINSRVSIDSYLWNQFDHWKFAWGDRCTDFWCFAETAWGDQYAYSMDALRVKENAAVYVLDANSMAPQVAYSSFDDFFEAEFFHCAREPYDQMTIRARSKFGTLDVSQHLVYLPSLLLGGVESLENMSTMNARAAMICNGDLAIQIDDATVHDSIESVQSYQDLQGRTRLRIEWA